MYGQVLCYSNNCVNQLYVVIVYIYAMFRCCPTLNNYVNRLYVVVVYLCSGVVRL